MASVILEKLAVAAVLSFVALTGAFIIMTVMDMIVAMWAIDWRAGAGAILMLGCLGLMFLGTYLKYEGYGRRRRR
jgi:hypothetical protein